MRTALAILAVLVFAGAVYANNPVQEAVNPVQIRAEAPVEVPANRDEYYQPPHVYLWTLNASAGFGSELIDDVPDELYCYWITGVDFYVGLWGDYWMDPDGVIVNFYSEECPPGNLVHSEFLPWGALDKEIVWDDPGWFTAFWCYGVLEDCIHVDYDLSIGFQVVNWWGDVAPYMGVVTTDDYLVFGDCEAWWRGAYWGYEGYVSGYFGVPVDVAYSLDLSIEPSATENTSWGQVKSLYR
jgi:hypothetical protein